MRLEKSVGCVVFREGKFLLLKHPSAKGHWSLPKGHVEKGESEEETLRREVKEETGLSDLRLMQGFREEIGYVFRDGPTLVNKSVVFYLAETKQDKVRLSKEHSAFAWLGLEAALERLTFENDRNVLRKAAEFLKI